VFAGGQLGMQKESDAMATNDTRKVKRWAVDRLRPHPKQGQYFANPPPHEVEELAADMKANGQLQPVEALPDGTVIAGHKRLAAARLLGWPEIDVWVRADLAGDPAAAERRLIEDNLNRRQLGPLGLARCYQALKALASKGLGGRLMDYQQRDLRDRLAQRLGGVSGRTLDRYLRVLEHTPPEVQGAAEAGTLPLTVAEKVAGLSKQRRGQIAEELRAGGEPKEVVRRFLAAAPARTKNAIDAKDRLVKALTRGAADLDGRVEEVHSITDADEEALRGGERLIRRLQEWAGALRAAGAEEVDPEAGEADGGPADPSGPDNVAGGTGRPRLGGSGEEPKYSATSGDGPGLPGDRPGQAPGRTASKPGRPGPAGAEGGRARP
jgi:ParB-like chromosome segregation protein Spo0J